VDEKTAILVSVTCVLIFGEILPSAIMTGPAQLMIAAALAPFIRVLLIVTSPISWPMAKLLDAWLGHDDGMTRFKRNEFKALIKLQHRAKGWKARSGPAGEPLAVSRGPSANATHRGSAERDAALDTPSTGSKGRPAFSRQNSAASGAANEKIRVLSEMISTQQQGPGSANRRATLSRMPSAVLTETDSKQEDLDTDLTDDEVTILHAVFSLQAKRVEDLLDTGRNTWDDMRMLGEHQLMNVEVMSTILSWGVSRIPIYRNQEGRESRHNVIGLMLVKDHILLDPDDAVPISSLRLRRPMVVPPKYTIFDMLNIFQTGRSHMALISEDAQTIEECWARNVDVPSHVKIMGVCTIEDVVEELIGEEVLDELDSPITDEEKQLYHSSNTDLGGRVLMAAPASTEAERALPYSAKDRLLG